MLNLETAMEQLLLWFQEFMEMNYPPRRHPLR